MSTEPGVRRPDLAKPYEPPIFVSSDDLPPDWMALLSLLFGLVGLIAKVKIASWLALYACMSSLANVKRSQADYKQILCSVTFAVMGLWTNYFRVTNSLFG